MSSSRTHASRVLALVTIVALLVGLGSVRAGAQIEPDDDDTTSSFETTTTRNVLVAGDGSDGAASTTTPSTSVVQASEARGDGLSETTAVWAIVGGLLAVAIGILFWTVHYWRKTSPAGPPRRTSRPKGSRPPGSTGGTSRDPNAASPPTRTIEPGATTRTPGERAAVRNSASRPSGRRTPLQPSRPSAPRSDQRPRPARRRPMRPDDTDGRTPIRK